MARGTLILVVGPTGSGKSVLMEHARTQFPHIQYLRSYTTRPRRSALENASYEFIDQTAFDAMVAAGQFIEWATFGNACYGTRRADVEEGLAKGHVLIKEMEVQGIRQTLAQLPREAVKIIYIDAGSWEELERRVRARAPISDEELAKRKQRYEDELPFKETADVVVRNFPEKLDDAKLSFEQALLSITGTTR